MDLTRKISLAAAIAALGVATALSIAGGAGAQGTIVGCTPATNIQAIIDDSGSMSGTDRDELRRIGLQIFIGAGSNDNKRLGAVEFGSSASTVFGPRLIKDGRSDMIAALRAAIDSNNGGTDYNSGFIKAFQDNPTANARIFLTDGADNGGFTNTHKPGPRTYVVGLGIGAAGTNEDANRLQQIANDTGGFYFPGVDASSFQPTFNAITAAVSCLRAPRVFTSRLLTKVGQTTGGNTGLARSTTKVDLVLNWAKPSNAFGFSTIQALDRRNRVLADLTGAGRRAKLRTRKTSGETFQTVTITKPRGTSKVLFRAKVKRIAIPERTITQLTQRR